MKNKFFILFLQEEDLNELLEDQWLIFFSILIGSLEEQAYKDLSSRDSEQKISKYY